MLDRLYETQLDKLTPIEVISGLVMALNPLTLLISIAGIIAMFRRSMKVFRPLSVSILLSVLLLALSRGKGYYFFPIALTVFAFGGVFWENVILATRNRLIYPVALILLSGVVLIPFGMPIFPLESYLSHGYPYENKEIRGGEYAVKFDERYSKEKWAVTLKELQNVYEGLPNEEKENAVIRGKHYGRAGAVNLFCERYAIPKAFSLHGSFYNSVPKGEMPKTTLVLCYDVGDFFQEYFNEVIKVKTIYNPYADTEEELFQHIYICKEPKLSFEELKELFRDRVFE